MRSDFIRLSISDAFRVINGKNDYRYGYPKNGSQCESISKLKRMYDDYKKNLYFERVAETEYFALLVEKHSYDYEVNEVMHEYDMRQRVRGLKAWLLNRMEVFVKLRWDNVTVGEIFLFRLMADERIGKHKSKYVDPALEFIGEIIDKEHLFRKYDDYGQFEICAKDYYSPFRSWVK